MNSGTASTSGRGPGRGSDDRRATSGRGGRGTESGRGSDKKSQNKDSKSDQKPKQQNLDKSSLDTLLKTHEKQTSAMIRLLNANDSTKAKIGRTLDADEDAEPDDDDEDEDSGKKSKSVSFANKKRKTG